MAPPAPASPRSARRRLPAWEVALFTLIVVGGALLGANALVEWLERRGAISPAVGLDGHVVDARELLFEADGQGWWVTTAYGRQALVPARLRVDRGDALRLFVLGGSMAMGTPYVHQMHAEERFGGLASWLREHLSLRLGGRAFEVVNVASGAGNSSRVRAVAEQIAPLGADVWIVATCNNEGVLDPDGLTARLRQSGAFRLLERALRPGPGAQERPLHTPQDPDTDAVREQFRANLVRLADLADLAGLRLFLCTLPVNLRYAGDQPGHALPVRPVPRPAPTLATCVEEGRRLADAGDAAGAEATWRACPDAEALRDLGLHLWRLGRGDEARRALEQYVEWQPRNRCRPSFNQVIREVAAARPGVHLVDLEAAARALVADGIPGDEIFVDYCHMTWRAYAALARTLTGALEAAGLVPAAPAGARVDEAALGRRYRLEQAWPHRPAPRLASPGGAP